MNTPSPRLLCVFIHAARRVGCGVQLRVRSTTSSDAAAAAAAATTGDSRCAGTNLYFPEILSDALEFLGAGLCWRLDKASAALHLSSRGGVERGVVSGLTGEGPADKPGAPRVVEGLPLQGPSDPAILLIKHLLRIDTGTMEAASASQVGCRQNQRCRKWDSLACSVSASRAGGRLLSCLFSCFTDLARKKPIDVSPDVLFPYVVGNKLMLTGPLHLSRLLGGMGYGRLPRFLVCSLCRAWGCCWRAGTLFLLLRAGAMLETTRRRPRAM